MVLKGLSESLKTIRLLAVGTDAYGKATQKSIVKYQVMRGLLGPIVDLMYEMTANVRLLTEVLAPNAEAMDKTEEAATALGPAILGGYVHHRDSCADNIHGFVRGSYRSIPCIL